jgi:hypothetical protein
MLPVVSLKLFFAVDIEDSLRVAAQRCRLKRL